MTIHKVLVAGDNHGYPARAPCRSRTSAMALVAAFAVAVGCASPIAGQAPRASVAPPAASSATDATTPPAPWSSPAAPRIGARRNQKVLDEDALDLGERAGGGRGELASGSKAGTGAAGLAGREPLASQPVSYSPDRGAHPAVVALANERGVMCSGVVVHRWLILTARHCSSARLVLFGRDASDPSETRAVRAWRAPPYARLDIALIVLDEPTRVAPYPLRPASDSAPPRGEVRLIGFGAIDALGVRGAGSRRLVDVPMMGWGCDPAREATTGCNGDFEMVLPRGSGNDTCSGDSGGPVLEEVEGRLRVVAVTSRSVSGAVLPCGDGGIYTRVDRVGAWLTSELAWAESREGNR